MKYAPFALVIFTLVVISVGISVYISSFYSKDGFNQSLGMVGITVPILTKIRQGLEFPAIAISVGGKAPVLHLMDTASAELRTEGERGGEELIIQYEGKSGLTDTTGYLQDPKLIMIGKGSVNVRTLNVDKGVPMMIGFGESGLFRMYNKDSVEVLPPGGVLNREVAPIFALLPKGSRKLRFDMINKQLSFGLLGSGDRGSTPLVGRYRYIIKCRSGLENGPSYIMLDTGTYGYYQNIAGPNLKGSILRLGHNYNITISLKEATGSIPLDVFGETIGLDQDFVILGVEYLNQFDFTLDIDNRLMIINRHQTN
jgi:hypothetical protein